MKQIIMPLTLLFSLLFLSNCSKKDNNPGPSGQIIPDDTTVITVVKLEDTLARSWEVKKATHNGLPDGSSVGLKLTINKNGSYLLHSSSYTGTWEFIDNKTKVLLDKNEPNYKTTWTIESLTSKKMKVSFKSPFTGGNAVWEMESY